MFVSTSSAVTASLTTELTKLNPVADPSNVIRVTVAEILHGNCVLPSHNHDSSLTVSINACLLMNKTRRKTDIRKSNLKQSFFFLIPAAQDTVQTQHRHEVRVGFRLNASN